MQSPGSQAPKEAHSPSPRILHPSGEEFQAVSGQGTYEGGQPKAESKLKRKVRSKENTKRKPKYRLIADNINCCIVYHCSQRFLAYRLHLLLRLIVVF